MQKPVFIARNLHVYAPLLVLVLIALFLLKGLWLDPKKLPSALIGKPVPAATLRVLSFGEPEGSQSISTDAFNGKPWVLNVFASWCQACLLEHPHLLEMSQQKKIRLVGLAYKDDLNNTRRWLQEHGNPYDLILIDQQGEYGIELGVYGVPETFLMNEKNTVLNKQVGPLNSNYIDAIVLPSLEASR